MTEDIFFQNLPRLERLFGRHVVSERKDRLVEIFESTESSWTKNTARLAGRKIKNLLLAEAAPWSEEGTPRYFYNRIESRYHLRIWKAFFGDTAVPENEENAFAKLAQQNFLLVDTVPFSMKFSSKQRRHEMYFDITLNSLEWWKRKLYNDGLEFAEKVNVAFAFKLNGQAIIKAANGRLDLPQGQTIVLNTAMIAANTSGFTDSERLRILFKL